MPLRRLRDRDLLLIITRHLCSNSTVIKSTRTPASLSSLQILTAKNFGKMELINRFPRLK